MNIFITGATDGIGKQTALEIAQLGHRIFIHGRSEQRLLETKNWIIAQVPQAIIDTYRADFASLSEIKKMAENFLTSGNSLDILINNAGVFEKQFAYSSDGFERTFAINHLAYFYLTHLFLPLLISQPDARIINVASMAQASSIDFNSLNAEKGYNPYDAYALSKLCNVLFSFKLARDLKDKSVSVNTLHPGEISTKILHTGWGFGGSSWHAGASNLLFLAVSKEGKENTGEYYVNKRKSQASKAAYIIENQEKLWKISCRMCNILP